MDAMFGIERDQEQSEALREVMVAMRTDIEHQDVREPHRRFAYSISKMECEIIAVDTSDIKWGPSESSDAKEIRSGVTAIVWR